MMVITLMFISLDSRSNVKKVRPCNKAHGLKDYMLDYAYKNDVLIPTALLPIFEDHLSSINILNYTSVSPDYFPASSGSSSFNSSKNSTDNMIPPVFSSFYNNPFLIFEIGKCSIKMYLKHQEEQIEDILNYLEELSFHRIEKMEEGRINGNELKTELKEIRTQIIKLQKKRLGQKDKIAFAHYKISDLERIIEKTQAYHQTNEEDL
ncbi:hypothetical protein Tco_1438288 [Tanacetum coccineum]